MRQTTTTTVWGGCTLQRRPRNVTACEDVLISLDATRVSHAERHLQESCLPRCLRHSPALPHDAHTNQNGNERKEWITLWSLPRGGSLSAAPDPQFRGVFLIKGVQMGPVCSNLQLCRSLTPSHEALVTSMPLPQKHVFSAGPERCQYCRACVLIKFYISPISWD